MNKFKEFSQQEPHYPSFGCLPVVLSPPILSHREVILRRSNTNVLEKIE